MKTDINYICLILYILIDLEIFLILVNKGVEFLISFFLVLIKKFF